jgi:hypothetical protein
LNAENAVPWRLRAAGALALALLPAAGLAEREGDDPGERHRARLEWYGQRTAADEVRILDAARGEALRWNHLLPHPGRMTPAVTGQAWVNIGPTDATFQYNDVLYYKVDSGRAQRIIQHPQDYRTVYLATSGGGVWKTFDEGKSWIPITESIGSLSIGAMAMDPQNPDTLYLGLGDPYDVAAPGILKTFDGGATWSAPVFLSGKPPGATAAKTAVQTRDLAVSPIDPATVLAASDLGLFRSADGGQTFQYVDLPNGTTSRAEEAWSLGYVGGHSWLVSGIDDQGAGGMWRSTDDGVSWTKVTLPGGGIGRMTLAVAQSTLASGNARVYAQVSNAAGNAQSDVYRSDDGGKTFHGMGVNSGKQPLNPISDASDLDVMNGQAWYNQMIVVDPNDPDWLAIGGNLVMARSQDGGATWAIESDWLPFDGTNPTNGFYAHADWHTALVGTGPAGAKRFFGGTDGGIFVSDDVFLTNPGKASFDDKWNVGIVTHLAYSIGSGDAVDPASTVVLGGLQDNGTRLRHGATTAFDQVIGGDGFGVAVSHDPLAMMGSVNGAHMRTVDGGQTWVDAESGLGGFGPWVVRYAALPDDASGHSFLTVVSLAGGCDVFKTTTTGQSWVNASTTVHLVNGSSQSSFPGSARNVGVSQTKGGVWGFLTSGGRAYSTIDAGGNWQQSNVPSSGQGIAGLSSIAFDPTDAQGNTFYVTSASSTMIDTTTPVPDDFGHVYKTADRGTTWTAIPGAVGRRLPNVPANVVKVDPVDPLVLYVGTEVGAYRSLDGGQSWERFGVGLPLVSVTDMSISLDGTLLRISTFGRGFWEIFTKAGTPAGVLGKGDFDHDQVIDGFDVLREAALLGKNTTNADYDPEGNLTGATNEIDEADLAGLLAKIGGRP